MKAKPEHYQGIGCACGAECYEFCLCLDADWRTEREVELEELCAKLLVEVRVNHIDAITKMIDHPDMEFRFDFKKQNPTILLRSIEYYIKRLERIVEKEEANSDERS